jgi:hypothetical protein
MTCGPLDLGAATMTLLPNAAVELAEREGTKSGRYDAARTIVKVQRRGHEQAAPIHTMERLRAQGLVAPALLDSGAVATRLGDVWWAIYARAEGSRSTAPTAAQQRAIGAQLRLWHTRGEIVGLRLDDPGAATIFFGTAANASPRAFSALVAALDGACRGRAMGAIHGDLAASHNALFVGDRLSAVLDPGAIAVAPPMLDLALALAVDLPRGGAVDPLLEGYGTDGVDTVALAALLPVMLARRCVDARVLRLSRDLAWLEQRLSADAPQLLEAISG